MTLHNLILPSYNVALLFHLQILNLSNIKTLVSIWQNGRKNRGFYTLHARDANSKLQSLSSVTTIAFVILYLPKPTHLFQKLVQQKLLASLFKNKIIISKSNLLGLVHL